MENNNDSKRINSANWKAFWQLLIEANPPKWMLLFTILLSLFETGIRLVIPLLTMSFVNQFASSSLQIPLIIMLVVVIIIQAFSSGVSFYFMTYIGEAIVASIRTRLWEQILLLPISFFDKHQSGETMSRVIQDTNLVKNLITQHLIVFLTGLISIIGSIIFLLMIDWKMTLIMIISVPIATLVIQPLGRKMYKISIATQDEMAHFSGNLGRVLSEIRLVKAFQAEKSEKMRGLAGIQQLFQFGLKEAKIQAVISPFMSFVIMLVLVILIGYGGVQVSSGALTAGSLVAIIIYMFQIVIPFTQMASFFTDFQKTIGATERIQGILSLEKESSKKMLEVHNDAENLIFQNLLFSYNKGNEIIKGINLTIPTGKTTAFVGPSGSGKTTLFALLERFYKPDSGEILLGKTNIDDFTLQSWRSQFGYVSQESPLMSGTIRENIKYGIERVVSDEELEQAIEQANAMEFIKKLPDGIETEVGERGIKLSGGQRQRIAIARAIIRNPKILLLDEASSNLDSASESLVQKALKQLMKGRTTLVIAHRLSTVIDADQIAILENGKITGIGTHDELFASHFLYRKLAEQQLQKEELEV